jgi:tRNA(Ile)-lysidine synthase
VSAADDGAADLKFLQRLQRDTGRPVSAREATNLFRPFARARSLVLAVSGGPDSTALLILAARWRGAREHGPKLFSITVDHVLRPQSAAEARAVKALARRLGIAHRTLRWTGKKPPTGLQEVAREARYRLLASAARKVKASHVVTAHTLDDQAETILMRMARGSGVTGLGAMRKLTPLMCPHGSAHSQTQDRNPLLLARPLLDIPKARLIATLRGAKVEFADDASNRDPRFARSRMRRLMPLLATEGLDAGRIALFARRLRRADKALEHATDAASGQCSSEPWTDSAPIVFDLRQFRKLPAEVALRLLGRAIGHVGGETTLRLGKLEALHEALAKAFSGRGPKSGSRFRLRSTLAGALVTLRDLRVVIERAPVRRTRAVTLSLNHRKKAAAGPCKPR